MPLITWILDRNLRPIFGKPDKVQCFLIDCDFCREQVGLELDNGPDFDSNIDEAVPHGWAVFRTNKDRFPKILCPNCVSRIVDFAHGEQVKFEY